jgi:hypothetical protein
MGALAASVVLIAFLLGVLLLVAFDLFCLVHLAAADRGRFLPKLAWAVMIACISPLGGAVYLLCQRQPKHVNSYSCHLPGRQSGRIPRHCLDRATGGPPDDSS